MKQNDASNRAPWDDSSADSPILAELANKPKRPWLVFVAGMILLMFIVGLVIGPLVYFALPGEVARWRIASAEEKRLNGDITGAIQDLDKALQEDPNNVQLLRTRSQWRLDNKEYSAALADIEQLGKLRPEDETLAFQHINILQAMGRHADAVTMAKQWLKMGTFQKTQVRAVKLNMLAYCRALANTEIDEGLTDIDEAIRIMGEKHEFIDTRGFLYYRDGDLERALNDLNRAVDMGEEEYTQWLELTNKGRLGSSDRRELDLQARERARPVAVIRYHRALIHEGLGHKEQATNDYKRVRELGFEPNDELF
jgi:tetratricopeptide (TPR) repeat protein